MPVSKNAVLPETVPANDKRGRQFSMMEIYRGDSTSFLNSPTSVSVAFRIPFQLAQLTKRKFDPAPIAPTKLRWS